MYLLFFFFLMIRRPPRSTLFPYTDALPIFKEVKNLVNLQQQMAADCRVAFLNFYHAMGGSGSMKRLVDRNMANKDYTHLSFGGGKWVAGKVFPSFLDGLKNYKRRKALEQQ